MLNVVVEVVGPTALIIGLWTLLTALALIALTLVTMWTTGNHGVVMRQPPIF